MDAQKIAQRLYESFDSDDLCEHPEIVDAVEDLADEYEGIKVENAKLKAQNKRIRKWYTALKESQQKAFARSCEAATNNLLKISKLNDENAELRQLVRDLYRCDDESCTHCKYWNQGDGFYCDLGVGWKARRMKELGIEADDD